MMNGKVALVGCLLLLATPSFAATQPISSEIFETYKGMTFAARCYEKFHNLDPDGSKFKDLVNIAPNIAVRRSQTDPRAYESARKGMEEGERMELKRSLCKSDADEFYNEIINSENERFKDP